MKIVIANDHAGVELKEYLKKNLSKVEFKDLGANTADSVDYPDYGIELGKEIETGKFDFGILICGSGVGISIAANRNPNVRAALCHNTEIAKLARQHNDANVVVLGSRFLSNDEALNICNTFLGAKFEGGRHTDRVKKLYC